MNIKKIVEQVLFEQDNIKQEKKSIHIYYKTDILIQNYPEEQKTGEEGEETEEVPEVPPTTTDLPPKIESRRLINKNKFLLEDMYKIQAKGEHVVSGEKAEDIQTLEDLVEYSSEIQENGKAIMNDLTQEIILTTAGIGSKALEDIINEGDKIIIDIDYGTELENSVGIKINKIVGSTSISISMKKDGKILPNEFNLQELNKQLVFFRNSLVG